MHPPTLLIAALVSLSTCVSTVQTPDSVVVTEAERHLSLPAQVIPKKHTAHYLDISVVQRDQCARQGFWDWFETIEHYVKTHTSELCGETCTVFSLVDGNFGGGWDCGIPSAACFFLCSKLSGKFGEMALAERRQTSKDMWDEEFEGESSVTKEEALWHENVFEAEKRQHHLEAIENGWIPDDHWDGVEWEHYQGNGVWDNN